MPYPHRADCRCPPLPPDPGLLAYTVDCEHYEQLIRALARLHVKLPAVVPEQRRPPINRKPARQPWEPRPARRRNAA